MNNKTHYASWTHTLCLLDRSPWLQTRRSHEKELKTFLNQRWAGRLVGKKKDVREA